MRSVRFFGILMPVYCSGRRHVKHAVSIDIGGTRVKWGVVSEEGETTQKGAEDTLARSGPRGVAEQIAAIVKRVRGAYVIAGVGVGCPGLIDPTRTIDIFSPNLYNPDGTPWRHVPLAAHIQEALGDPSLEVKLENDANAMALGELIYGAGRGFTDMIGMTIGTGIGGGVALNGKLYRGAGSMAGEIGHMTAEPGGRLCGCGNFGCLEAMAGKNGIIERTLKAMAEDARPSMLDRHLDALKAMDDRCPEIIEAAAREGDQLAARIFAETGRYIGRVLASLANFLNPQAVVIGGGIANAGDILFPHIEREIERRAFRECADAMQILPAQHGNDAGMLGAAALILNPEAAG